MVTRKRLIAPDASVEDAEHPEGSQSIETDASLVSNPDIEGNHQAGTESVESIDATLSRQNVEDDESTVDIDDIERPASP